MGVRGYSLVAMLDDVPPGKAKVVELGGRSILLSNSEDRTFAIANECAHAHEPLACGRIKRGWIACPAHGARFDLASGEPINPPATEPVETFAVRIVDNMIEVAL